MRRHGDVTPARQNGGIWPFDGWRFFEWFHGRTLQPMGMARKSWNAAAWLRARRAPKP